MTMAESLVFLDENMMTNFLIRTQLHVQLVKKNLLLMKGYHNLSRDCLQARAKNQDESKYREPERTAYTWITQMYHCRNNNIAFCYPEGVQPLVTLGWKHHIENNSHHPEAHKDPDSMSKLDIVEMICDWTAIAEEGKNNSAMDWAMTNIDKKWDFSKATKKFIYATISELDARRQCHLSQSQMEIR